MVRLKVLLLYKGVAQIPNFNSTMVRLKEAQALGTGTSMLFQFHYGTIKSWNSYGISLIQLISIPLWYD